MRFLLTRVFNAFFIGNLASGYGEFSLLNFNFKLLSLFAPIPSAIDGYFGLKGKYSLVNGTPEVNTEIVFEDSKIYDRNIILDKGNILFKDNYLEFDISLRDKSSKNPVGLTGIYPLSNSFLSHDIYPFVFRVCFYSSYDAPVFS